MRRRAVLLIILLPAFALPIRGDEPQGSRDGSSLSSSDTSATSTVDRVHDNLPIPNWLEHVSQPLRRLDLKVNSAASCASTACHGGPRAGIKEELAVRGSEYPLWLENDPHARSWRTMCGQASVDILERLSIMRGGKVLDQAAFDNCLKCHNTTRGYPINRATEQSVSDVNRSGSLESKQEFHAEGVGCASCHGPSELWLSEHYRTSWNNLDSSTLGLVPNKNLVARARGCAACHIGDSDRDMNHDLIAAGHPAMHYEFSTYHNMLPKHWREQERSAALDFEAQLWIAGQIAALDASLALLESRAAKRSPAGVWPEFAALDCSACHQGLRLDREDYSAVRQTRIAGLSHWNRFGVEQLLKLHETSDAADVPGYSAEQSLAVALRQISTLIGGRVTPDARATQTAASHARRALDRWLSQSGLRSVQMFSADKLSRLAATSLSDRPSLDSWEYTAQSYLAAIAARRAWLGDESSLSFAEARRLQQALLFKPGAHSLAVPDEPRRMIAEKAKNLADLLGGGRIPPISLPEQLPSPPPTSTCGDEPGSSLERGPAPLQN